MMMGSGGVEDTTLGTSTNYAIDSSNIGFKLLKKHGWTEGTGLGIAQQGRLEPVPAYIKKNKRGLGAEKSKKTVEHPKSSRHSSGKKIVNDGEKETVAITACDKNVLDVFECSNERSFDGRERCSRGVYSPTIGQGNY